MCATCSAELWHCLKKEITSLGGGRRFLSAIVALYGLKGDYLVTLAGRYRVFVTLRSFATEAASLGVQRHIIFATSLRCQDPDMNVLLEMRNPFSARSWFALGHMTSSNVELILDLRPIKYTLVVLWTFSSRRFGSQAQYPRARPCVQS